MKYGKGREQRRIEAAQREQARKNRTAAQQLEVLRARGVTSGREWDRLERKAA